MNKNRNDIDKLNISLTEIKNILPKNSIISFITNFNESNNKELYFKTQFVLVPRVLVKDDLNNDTILIIDSPSIEEKSIVRDAIALYSDSNNLYNIKLLRKNK